MSVTGPHAGNTMMFLPDGSPFTSFGIAPDEGLVAVGWLENGKPFARGEVPREFITELKDLCRKGVNRTRGLHRCTLCADPDGAGLPSPTRVALPSGDFIVGGAEIIVEDATGTWYAAPDMIIHYVEEHDYRPPDAFIEAVLHRRASRG